MRKAKRIKNYQVLLLVGVIIFIVLVLNIILFFAAKPNIAVNYVAERNELTKPEHYDPNQNAYFDYAKVSSFLKIMPEGMLIHGSYKWPEWPGEFEDGELTVLKDWMAENNQHLEGLKAGSGKPYYWFEAPQDKPRWEIRNNLPIEIRAGITALCWRAKLKAFENRMDDAIDDLLAGFKISSQLNRPQGRAFEQHYARGMQSEAIKTFLTIFNNRQIDAERLSDFHRQVKDLMARNSQGVNINEEKMFAGDIVQRVFTDDGNGGGHLIAGEAKKTAKSIEPSQSGATIFPSAGGNTLVQKFVDTLSYIKYDYKGGFPNFYWMAIKGTDRKKTTDDLEKIYSYLEGAQQITPYRLHSENIDLEQQVENMTGDYWAKMLAIAWYWPQQFEFFYQSKCESESFLTITALMIYKAKKGAFPDKLQELIDAGLIEDLPQDPYNDGPVVYKKVGDNFTLYSLGTNFKDNGGQILRDRYNGRIVWWDRQKRGDAVFWPYPNESKDRRLERMGKITVSDPNALLKEYGDPNKQSEK